MKWLRNPHSLYNYIDYNSFCSLLLCLFAFRDMNGNLQSLIGRKNIFLQLVSSLKDLSKFITGLHLLYLLASYSCWLPAHSVKNHSCWAGGKEKLSMNEKPVQGYLLKYQLALLERYLRIAGHFLYIFGLYASAWVLCVCPWITKLS